jgi:3-phosphoshikimate 1-carboxyvinyltransferase
MTRVVSHRIETVSGTLTVPGDKSISHRALIIGASAVGETNIYGLLEAGDVIATALALRRPYILVSPTADAPMINAR